MKQEINVSQSKHFYNGLMPRLNEVGIPLIPESMRKQLFGGERQKPFAGSVKLAKAELARFGLDNVEVDVPEDIEFELPPLQGADLEEHFNKIAESQAQPYLSIAEQMARAVIPARPHEILLRPGWTCYEPGEEPYPVPYPAEDGLVYDVEVAVKSSNYPVMASAVSPVAWYFWVSPKLATDGSDVLCPLGNSPKLVAGWNCSYDKQRTLEPYSLELGGLRFWDVMSMHQCVGGLSSKQRPLSLKNAKAKANGEDAGLDYASAWLDVSSGNSLKDAARLYLGVEMSKDDRDYFVTGTLLEIKNRFQQLADYCVKDTEITFKLYKLLWARFREKCPSNVTFFGMLETGTAILPITRESWFGYIDRAESKFVEEKTRVEKHLRLLADEAVEGFLNGSLDPKLDPWLCNLDWTMPSSRAKIMKDKPEWYRKLFKGEKINLTVKTQCTPYLLRLKWFDYPLYHHPKRKWGFVTPVGEEVESNLDPIYLNDVGEEVGETEATKVYYPIPHKDGDDSNVGCPLSKDYLSEMEKGVLNSDFPEAKQALEAAISCSYWVSVQSRVKSQFVVMNKDNQTGFIIPQMVVAGTVTGRAVESTWLTASNSKKNRIGSEIKTTIRIPEGYLQIGADVDS